MERICRLCLNEEAQLIELFTNAECNERIQKIHEISNILVTAEPNCPTGICLNCNRKLEISWEFLKQIQKSHIIITDTLKITCIEAQCDMKDIAMVEETVAPENADVFFEIAEVDEPLEISIKEEIPDAPSIDSQPTEESFKQSGSSQQTNNRFHCKMCNRNFNAKSTYATHMGRHKSSKWKHRCDTCGNQFFNSTKLNIHKRTHTSFKCSICGQHFLRASNLLVHEQAHSKERKYKCLICAKWFNSMSDRNEHFKIHTDLRLFKCKRCDYVATEVAWLDMHVRTHTN